MPYHWVVEVVGHKLATHHPVIESVSAAEPGTEICDAETGTQKPAYHPPEISPETRRECESPHSGATPSFLADEAADAAG
jgi:hypothetical protein